MKTLVLDLETRPSLAYVWKIWDENVSLSQLLEVGEVICFSAKWLGEEEVFFKSVYHHSKREMLKTAWKLMDEADAIIHYNGKNFDIKHLNREFLLVGMTPPSPHKDIDLLSTTRGRFKFVSNKLEHLANQLGLGGKVQNSGFQLWLDCMNNDRDAWNLMREYCIGDVVLTERVYYRLLPWIKSHPNIRLHDGGDKNFESPSCNNCGSFNIQRRGYAYTSVSRFQKYVCKDCGTWGRSGAKEASIEVRNVAG